MKHSEAVLRWAHGYHTWPGWDSSPKEIADVLEVSLDYLAGNSKKAAVDKKTMKLIHDIEDLEPAIKDKLIFLANAVIRDAKTGKAYAH